jgi:hypothetical protein
VSIEDVFNRVTEVVQHMKAVSHLEGLRAPCAAPWA